MTQVAILGWYGSPNIGDEAELAAILAHLAAWPRPPRVVVFSTQPGRTRAQYRSYPGGLAVLPRNPLAPAALRTLRGSRLLILGGGGLIQDQTSIYNLPLFTLFGLLARGLGCPLQWWGVGVEPLVTPLGRAQARLLVRLAAPGGVSVRDANSRRLLVRAGVPAPAVRVSADPASATPPAAWATVRPLLPAAGDLESGRPWIAFCLRDLPNNPRGSGPGYLLPVAAQKKVGLAGQHTQAHARRAEAFYALLAQAADHLIATHGARVLFLPFWWGRDDQIAALVRGQMRHADQTVALDGALTPAQARAILGRMDLVVAVRLHALIFGAAAGVPGIGFSYAQKIRAFMQRTGQGARVLDLQHLTWPALQATLDQAWAGRVSARPALLAQAAILQAAVAQDAAVAARLSCGQRLVP
ncbi:MAG TPA: polysaccharide pyruvyl transferase family protein [Chloroflexia bacterium]|nr:polysaccharide pyruvyl transferase family protein [Chloroflexia bacterium]